MTYPITEQSTLVEIKKLAHVSCGRISQKDFKIAKYAWYGIICASLGTRQQYFTLLSDTYAVDL